MVGINSMAAMIIDTIGEMIGHRAKNLATKNAGKINC